MGGAKCYVFYTRMKTVPRGAGTHVGHGHTWITQMNLTTIPTHQRTRTHDPARRPNPGPRTESAADPLGAAPARLDEPWM